MVSRARGPNMKTVHSSCAALMFLLFACDRLGASASAGCSKDTDCKGDRVCQSGQCVAPAGSTSSATSTASVATATNDGTDPRSPVLAPADASFTDARHGWGWSDRCWNELHAKKFGWAMAACEKGLGLPDLDSKAKGALLYNEGLAYEGAHDVTDAKALFERSLAARAANDPGRAEVQQALARVGGPPAPAAAKTFACGDHRCAKGQSCCPDGSCVEPFQQLENCNLPDQRSCDPATNEPCDPGEHCGTGKIGHGPLTITTMCVR